MIFDHINNSTKYSQLNQKFEFAFEFLQKTNLNQLKPGRYSIEGDDIYALVQEYMTTPIEDRFFETHDNYIDLQYIIEGNENIYFANDNYHFIMKESYSIENDATLFQKNKDLSKYSMTTGDFAIFFPGEYHIPQCSLSKCSFVRKVVIKIRA